MTDYTEEDRAHATPGHFPLVGSDIEINANIMGGDVMLRVNKAGVLVFRVKLENAATAMTSDTLMRFSPFAPDFVFKIGDSVEGLERMRRSVGM